MFCSVIIPTIGRPSLDLAVRSALNQGLDDGAYEIIVVNDSGQPLPEADWHSLPLVRIVETQRRNRCMARNVGAAIANGTYFCFLDDDDWLLPDALRELEAVGQETAVWVYGGVQFVDEQGRHLGKFNLGKSGNCFIETVSALWIPLQASLIQAEAFFVVGGFDPLMPVNEDLDLCRRLAFVGEFANTPTTIACILRGTNWGSSTDTALGLNLNRWGRDAALKERGALRRLLDSAGSSSFYHGRILHAYIGSALLNIKHRRLWTAVSRVLFGAAGVMLSGWRLFSTEYWRALRIDTVMHELITDASPDFSSTAEWLH